MATPARPTAEEPVTPAPAVYTVPKPPAPVQQDPDRPLTVRLAAKPAATRPASTQPSTQPSPLAKYYHLLKKAFIKDPDGTVGFIPQELDEAIDRLRDNAAAQKGAIDSQIGGMTAGIAASEQGRKNAVDAARDNRADARAHANQSTYTHWRVNARGLRVHTHVNPYQVDAANAPAANARAADGAAKQQKSSVRAGCAPSDTIDLLGDSGQTIRYARVRIMN